ncbi:hypothetical protein [Pseudomonas aegrilactucae]|uniref:Uncharacterized protein n=1 Tax=Pseudomonas aegrilactucae TaxID=2854028 RepID=A0A9Q2XH68_9PSED|nr:hypothetical protein [Pseudomonas aegrilactucae]MBV6286001.1 hypothetical protein [Pseudomonas aegrilactucae]
MNRRLPLIALLVCLSLWVAACYGVRYGFMEDPSWVGVCTSPQVSWECQLRATLGLLIHFRVLGWAAMGLALVAFVVPRRGGWWLAVVSLVFGAAALVLYNVSLAVFAIVLAGLRLVRSRA